MNSKKFDYVIYHKNCLDGFTGFYILMRTHNITNDVIIYPDEPSTSIVPPNIVNKNIIIIDVAYKKEILENIINKAKFTLHIDHHITIRNDVLDLKSKYSENKFLSYFDNDESGAFLTWKYFKNDLEGDIINCPQLIKYVKDNDIGKWKYKETMSFILALQINYKLDPTSDNLSLWDKLLNDDEIDKLIDSGNKYMEYEKYLLEQNIKRISIRHFPGKKIFNKYKKYFNKIGQYKIAITNGSACPNPSILGKKIVEEIDCDFCIFWNLQLDKKKYVISFRSKSVDVGEIAKIFGGGGHKYAASCSFPINEFNIFDFIV